MADVIPHFCTGTGCEGLHGGHGQNPDVQIARIQADRDVRVAEIQRGETKLAAEAEVEATEVVAEAQIAETAIEAEAAVDEAVVENQMLEEIVNPEPEPATVVVEQAPDLEEDGEAATPPEVAPVARENASKGWWGSYR